MEDTKRTNEIIGSCHCGDVQVRATLSIAPSSLEPRQCDCSFCMKHGANYISDSHGMLEYKESPSGNLNRYRQGPDGTADFLLCAKCGVLVGVSYKGTEGRLYSTVNSNVFDGIHFGSAVAVSPKMLSTEQKVQRWEEIWFPIVKIAKAGGNDES